MAAGAGSLISGRYRLIEPVGRGGMGQVWRGHDETLDRDVAVKEVLLSRFPEAERPGVMARARREARAAARLVHPGVITVHDVAEHDGVPWIVMEFVPGGSLEAEIAEGGRLPWQRAALIGARVAEALAHAHAAGITHRDVKPANVLLAGDRVVVTDFGIARIIDATSKLTGTGALIGTPGFLAPEQLDTRGAGPASDMWALGVTLYNMVEGTLPFAGEGLHAVYRAILDRDPTPPAHAGPLASLIGQLLAKAPEQRPSAGIVAAALNSLAAAQPPAAAGTPASPPPGRSPENPPEGAGPSVPPTSAAARELAPKPAGPSPAAANTVKPADSLEVIIALSVICGIGFYCICNAIGAAAGSQAFQSGGLGIWNYLALILSVYFVGMFSIALDKLLLEAFASRQTWAIVILVDLCLCSFGFLIGEFYNHIPILGNLALTLSHLALFRFT